MPFLLLLVALSQLPALQGYFLGDDYNLLVGLERRGLVDFALLSQGDDRQLRFWRPLAFSLLELQRRLFGWQPAGYLLVGLGLHLAVVTLLASLYRRWLPTGAALLATALFALHPRHLETTAWISAQPDLWATLLVLATLLVWSGGRDAARAPSIGRTVAACLLAAAALLAKEVALSLPLLVLWLEQGPWRDRLRRTSPLFGVVAVYLAARLAVLGGMGGYGEAHFQLTPLAPLKTLGTFLAAFFVPVHTGPASDALVATLKARPALIVLAGAAIGAVGVLLLRRLLRSLSSDALPSWRRMAGLFLLTLLPLYNLSVSLSGRADRYLYLPSIALCALAGLMLARAAPSTRAVRYLRSVLVIGALLGARLDLAVSYRQAGALAHTIVDQVSREAAHTTPSKVYVAGVPDRLDGVGVLFTGLPKVVEARTGKQLVVAARQEMHGWLEPTVTWRLEHRERGIEPAPSLETDPPPQSMPTSLVGEASAPALLEGGYGWGGWQPGQPSDRKLKTRLTLPFVPDGLWLVVEGDRVRRVE